MRNGVTKGSEKKSSPRSLPKPSEGKKPPPTPPKGGELPFCYFR